ncbi:MAG: NUDIX domain-containing protein [Microgenomates group bacterium]
MVENQEKRGIESSVTCFVHCGDDFLFLHRNESRKVDANRLNGVGGKLDKGENFLDAAIRETREETGYAITKDQVRLAAVAQLHGGYAKDWTMCFFTIEVPTKKIPIGTQNHEGQLLWIPADQVLQSEFELVDDLNYCWEAIARRDSVLFFTAEVDDNEKIASIKMSELQ